MTEILKLRPGGAVELVTAASSEVSWKLGSGLSCRRYCPEPRGSFQRKIPKAVGVHRTWTVFMAWVLVVALRRVQYHSTVGAISLSRMGSTAVVTWNWMVIVVALTNLNIA